MTYKDSTKSANPSGKESASAEAKLRAAISSGKPTSKEESMEILAAFAKAGRMRKPGVGMGMKQKDTAKP